MKVSDLEVSLHGTEARNLKQNIVNHHSSEAGRGFTAQDSLPSLIIHLLSFPMSLNPSFLMAEKNKNTFWFIIQNSSALCDPNPDIQLLPSFAYKRNSLFKGNLAISFEVEDVPGRDGQ